MKIRFMKNVFSFDGLSFLMVALCISPFMITTVRIGAAQETDPIEDIENFIQKVKKNLIRKK